MTKTLILLRHAKSAWPDNVEDHDRPLAERGRRAAPLMARWLAENGLKPSVALVSTARRTQETWALVAPDLGKVARRDVGEIYEAPAQRILDAIHGVEPSVETLLVVGHNPGMEDLASVLIPGSACWCQLSGTEPPAAGAGAGLLRRLLLAHRCMLLLLRSLPSPPAG